MPGSGTMGTGIYMYNMPWVYGNRYESCRSRVKGTGPRPGPWVPYKLLYPDEYE